jgi:CheY-like chemotaxis protein
MTEHKRVQAFANDDPYGEKRTPLRVLLADDNPVNRMVAARTLAKRGHRVRAVENGADAVAAFGEREFDVIVMDVQMPEMDGLEATARIREQERGTPRRVLIVALTAHAMKWDRDRCFAAGMDEYVTKPFQAADLIRAVESRRETIASQEPPGEQILNFAALLERLEGDRSLAAVLAKLFLDEAAPLMDRVRTSLQQGDLDAMGKALHRLRGTLITIGAERAAVPALRLELGSRRGCEDVRSEDLMELEHELSRLEPELVALAAT